MENINKENRPKVGLGVCILKDGKVLLGKRNGDPKKADSELHGEGSWTMPGGKLEFKEELKAGAVRETIEEVGIKIDENDLRVISISNDISIDAHFVTIGFLCEKFEGEPRVTEPDEITEWEWFDLNNLPNPIFFPSQKILDNYFNKKIL